MPRFKDSNLHDFSSSFHLSHLGYCQLQNRLVVELIACVAAVRVVIQGQTGGTVRSGAREREHARAQPLLRRACRSVPIDLLLFLRDLSKLTHVLV